MSHFVHRDTEIFLIFHAGMQIYIRSLSSHYHYAYHRLPAYIALLETMNW